MLPRLGKILLLLFQAVFLNIIIPGHTRGIITLSGNNSVEKISDLGCPLCCCAQQSHPQKAPTEKDKSECAICHFAAGLITPPPIDFAPPLLCLARVTNAPAPMLAPAVRFPAVHHDRAPPMV